LNPDALMPLVHGLILAAIDIGAILVGFGVYLLAHGR
jgi:hypothetical protein